MENVQFCKSWEVTWRQTRRFECSICCKVHIDSPPTTKIIVLTPSESQLDDPSTKSTGGRDSRLFLLSPKSEIAPLDFVLQEHTSKDGALFCYYEDVALIERGVGDA